MSEIQDSDTSGLASAIFELWLTVTLADIGVDSYEITDNPKSGFVTEYL